MSDGLQKQPVQDADTEDLIFIAGVGMLQDGYSTRVGQHSTHKLACLHANLIAVLAARFSGADRALLLADVQEIISNQVLDIDPTSNPNPGQADG